ncbi:MAG: radical SAM protein [Lachnospiraceae bacterium]|nr:radical SAM protein [Lachnospiraceae bacterium]
MDEIIESPLVEYLHCKADATGIPLSGTFELTPCCNMDCRMCYVRLSEEEVKRQGRLRTTEEWIRLAEDAKNEGMLFLLLTGGEPFIRKDFKELYEAFRQMGLVISINSNATLLDEKWVSWLEQRRPARMNVTLYGASDETYKRLCRNPKGFTQVTAALKRLKEAEIPVKLNCSLTPYNIGDMEEIQKFAIENEYPIETAVYMFPPIRKTNNCKNTMSQDSILSCSNNRFNPKETALATIRLELLRNGEEAFREHCEKILKGQSSELTRADRCFAEGQEIQCRAGGCSFWITWDGRMLPCGLMPRPVMEPFRDGFSKSWLQLKEEVKKIRLPIQCAECKDQELCHTCAAMIYAETGDFKEVPKYRCELVEEYKKACKKAVSEVADDE